MMHGGAMVRSRKIRIIKNAPISCSLSLADSAFCDIGSIDLNSAADYHPLGERDTAKVAVCFEFSDLRDVKMTLNSLTISAAPVRQGE
jgi:hypothetical protein